MDVGSNKSDSTAEEEDGAFLPHIIRYLAVREELLMLLKLFMDGGEVNFILLSWSGVVPLTLSGLSSSSGPEKLPTPPFSGISGSFSSSFSLCFSSCVSCCCEASFAFFTESFRFAFLGGGPGGGGGFFTFTSADCAERDDAVVETTASSWLCDEQGVFMSLETSAHLPSSSPLLAAHLPPGVGFHLVLVALIIYFLHPHLVA